MITSEWLIPESIRDRIWTFVRPAELYDEGAAAITIGDCEAAISLINDAKGRVPRMQMPFSVSPSVRGGIGIHWIGNGYELYIRVTGDSSNGLYSQWETP